ncbi:MAG TPA: ester cyclase [Acidimicrobiales bacterium]|nr:ester cyclase [Acidimicrobiales bacterium]
MPDPRAVVERLIETINAHDAPGGRALFSAHVRAISATGRHLDLDGLDAMLHTTVAAFPDMKVHVVRWITDGDVVVTEEVLVGTHRGTFAGLAPTGRRVRLPLLHITRVRDGRIVERIAYHDTAGILRQLKESATASR